MPFKDLSCENGIVAVYMHYNAVPKNLYKLRKSTRSEFRICAN